MKLIKIGDRTVNMDVVREIRGGPDGLTLAFIDGQETQLRGTEADVFRQWLAVHAQDLTPQPFPAGATEGAAEELGPGETDADF